MCKDCTWESDRLCSQEIYRLVRLLPSLFKFLFNLSIFNQISKYNNGLQTKIGNVIYL